MEDITLLSEVLKTNTAGYHSFYERSRQAYVNFVNFAPTVSAHMHEVDKWYQQFELRR